MVELATQRGTRISSERITLYWDSLQDLPMPALVAAFVRARKESTYFPQASDIRGFVEATGDDAIMLAWTAFISHASKTGAYRKLITGDPCAADALLCVFGSWPKFCEECGCVSASAWRERRLQFFAAYRDAARIPRGDEVKVLPGLSAQLGEDVGSSGQIGGANNQKLLHAAQD